MKVDISMYEALRSIAKGHKIKNRQWAASAGVPEPRISELNRIAKEGGLYGRVCTLGKVMGLYDGLVKLLGEGTVRHDLERLLEGEKDTTKRLIIMCLILGQSDDKYKSQAEMMLQTLLRSIQADK